ncbi:hypothetical protein N7457_006650 [Penicillium paradoxum]|uniref:uncharacterized protein n=1 Tax=Penicillium paradoxum TaxID=176176 RepID=UPI0025469ED6|nr:uncharacterized protein N7457_006650 [Penicillium paradoxum]KAJ5778930.1 hypothetical protein N7457_006650 [Penicillium paradoxum]
MDSDPWDPEFLAAIEASRREMPSQPANASSSRVAQNDFVDLTKESDDDSDIIQVFPKSKSVVSSETEDGNDDEQLQRALAMSMESGENARPGNLISAPASLDAPVSCGVLSSMNRKQMEDERIARNAKRKLEDTAATPSVQPSRKLPRTEPVLIRRPVPPLDKRPSFPQAEPVPPSEVCRQVSSNASSVSIRPTSRSVPQWPLGAVKKTAIAGFPRSGNDITIEEVIQRDDLELGVFSSFLWDLEWFFTKINTQSSRILLIMQANDQETQESYRRDAAPMKNLRMCFPPIEPQVFCMHSKLTLLFHAEYLRIAVPTANLTRTDWGEDRLMENTVFLIDLPKTNSPDAGKTPFYEELVYFLRASDLHRNIIKKLDEFDFSETRRYAFVHTVGGANVGDKWPRTGFSGLGQAIKTLGLETNSPLNIDYVASSMGSLNTQFLRSIYLACKGDNALLDYELRTSRKKVKGQSHPADTYNKECLDRFRVYFPSGQTVREAHANPDNTAGTICFNPSWWANPQFPRSVMRDCVSERGVLMHNKLLYVHPTTPIDMPDNKECQGWAYVGSANLSESAWGRLVKDTTTKQMKMNCRNWECGVIVPIIREKITGSDRQKEKKKESDTECSTQSAPLAAEVFADTIPIPMRLPAVPLSQERKPFFYGA